MGGKKQAGKQHGSDDEDDNQEGIELAEDTENAPTDKKGNTLS